ncbi:hypothetical protein GQ44DRAFT_726880 [Phaeosphaeriaceae sp. PMI808]|nr:hypothetical protein GQ44DRAFT_726880 [Phaeosphaeriaceae sp. PMI808]
MKSPMQRLALLKYGPATLSAGVATTYINTTTRTSTFEVTYTTRLVILVTPSASTFTNVITTTETIETTTTSTPAPTTIPTPAGFLPLFIAAIPVATGASRVKRYEIEGRNADPALRMFKRQTAVNNTAGFAINRSGETSNMEMKHVLIVRSNAVAIVTRTAVNVVTGLPETSIVPVSTENIVSTSTCTLPARQTTLLELVSSTIGYTGKELIFDRVLYRPNEGFPINNELIVSSQENCHLRFTQAPVVAPPALPANSSYGVPPIGYGGAVIIPTGTSSAPVPTTTAGPSTIEGQTDFLRSTRWNFPMDRVEG